MTSVAMIFRKPQSWYFSIEKVFALVEPSLRDRVAIQKVYMPRHKFTLGTIFRNLAAAAKYKADIYHVTGDVHYTVLGLPSKRTILTIHDCGFVYQNKGLKRLLLNYLFVKWPVKKSAIVTTISEKSKQDIINLTGCSPDKVIVISNPLDEKFVFHPGNFNKSCPVILFVGITPNKNLFRVIEALEGIPCKLHVVGKIPSAEQEQLILRKIDFKESYSISEEELRKAYVDSDIVLFPSLLEGFGLPIIEGQQTGRAVITSNLSPMKEVAAQGACLVDPLSVLSIREGIIKVISNDEYRKEIIEQGLKNAQQYKPEKVADNYFKLYQRLSSSLN
jgi:glycosyltransferase involved in cell wall biosynthesis